MNMLKSERIFVTGATGFIGRALVRRLVNDGAAVTALVRERPGQSRRGDVPDGVAIAEVDLRYAAGVARAVNEADPTLVVHLAAAGVTDPFLPVHEALRGNLDATINLLKAVAGRCRVLVARTPGEREALNVYAAAKAAAWAFCQMYRRTEGWPIVGVMPFHAYGPGQPAHTLVAAAVRAAKAGERFPTTSGEQVRDWVYLPDVVEGFIAVARANVIEGDTVELGTGIGTPVREVVERIFKLAGQGRAIIGVLPQRPGEAPSQIADAARTGQLIGWRAQISLDEGLTRLLTTD